jgi:hypothetical protein
MAITAGVVGAGLIAGGTAAAIAAAKKKTQARRVQYGGSAEAGDALKQTYAAGADQGNQAFSQGVSKLNGVGLQGAQLATQGQAITNSAGGIAAGNYGHLGSQLLTQYQPGQVAAAQAQQAMDQNTAAVSGAARAGGALGLRNALNANANNGQVLAQNAGIQAAQEKQALLGAQVGQANVETQGQLDQNALAQQQRTQLLGLGTGVTQAGVNAQAGAASNIGQLGLADQGQFLNQQQNVYDQQNSNDVNYEQRRQADQQRRAQNLWGLGSSLIGSGAKAIGGGGG